ncbi:GNAT family N-acetyltransferase [Celeribacter sp.]|uniref:GNAT family N-acetyltransferase n=1 Tax=Celeribacter sp. TaxID=1890673 RepID=UPI003A935123
MQVSYTIEPDLTAEAFLDVLRRSTLAERRPIEDVDKIAGMVAGADVIVTARDETGTLLGVARSITDFHFALYCSELCVDEAAQGHGIGKELLAQTVKAAPNCKNYLLLSTPKAVSFYEAAGYTRHDDCFLFA